MRNLFRKLWHLEGTIDGRTYAIGGVIGFILKYLVDYSVARFGFHYHWKPIYYWNLVAFHGHRQPGEFAMYGTLIILSLPFLWFGMTMTLLRLRDVGKSAGWAALFFFPVVNAVMFAVLSFMEPRPLEPRSERQIAIESGIVAVIAAVALGVATMALSTSILATYGVGLFVAIPFCTGYLAAVLHRKRSGTTSKKQAFAVATFSMLILGGFLVAVAWEGFFCLAMALPIAIIVALLGAYCGYAIHSDNPQPPVPSNVATYGIVFLLPLVIGGEAALHREAPTYEVSSSIVINAPPEVVWNNVVTFSEITERPEWYFRGGIAYPLRARIVGRGAGAVRYCEFTTGPFIEPITVWDEPRLLRFSVSQNPAPMFELSPYDAVDAPHLHGYFVSHQGQFRLEPLAGGRTRVTGTTWYQHHLWPAAYWRVWSDAIIHRIHMRVLRHIRGVSESSTRQTTRGPETPRAAFPPAAAPRRAG